ncbi:TonB-dependent receptor [Sphingomonas limnosediminicola]|uniref:TonB-dependent receptor n=1 Tax=Sphingomonas limnosediminicola TaxID=940133 RepID=A0ABP7L6K4_9SPHN
MPNALPPSPPAAEIVVTGAALPEARAESAYSINLISGREIESSPSHALDQLLKDVPGVQLFRRSDSHSGHPTSQGVTLRALGGNASSRALLMLDGVPQTDPFGGWVNWPAYDPLGLRQIRIVRGGGSVANGPGALAGTIEMFSRSERGLSGEVDAGSRTSAEGRAYAGIATGDGVLSLSGRAERGGGFVPITEATRGPADRHAPYRDWSARAQWNYRIAADIKLQVSADGLHDWRTRGTDFSINRTNGADGSVRLVGHGRWQWSALAYWQWRNLMSSFASVGPGRAIATRVSLQYSVPSNGVGGSFELRPPMPKNMELRIGADTRRTTGESRELYNYVAGEPKRRRFAGGVAWTAGAFAEATVDFDPVTLTGGMRIDHWQVSNGHLFEQLIATSAVLRDDRDPERGGWLPTARGGVIARLGGGFRLRAAGYLGWRMPTLNELFRPFRVGLDATAANADLAPERLFGAEAGVEYARGNVEISLTGFVNRLSDAIANVTLGAGPGNFPGVGFVPAGGTYRQRQNVDAVDVHGLEAAAQWSRGGWQLQGGLSCTHARMRSTGAAAFLDGPRPAQTPDFAATIGAGYDDAGKGAQVIVRHVSAQFEDDLNTRKLNAATTVDAFASWPLSPRLLIVARAENLMDKLVMAGINADGSIERATPRTLWIGLRLR